MEAVTFNRNSIAFRIAKFPKKNINYYDLPDDICEYRSMIMWGVIRILLSIFSIGIYLISAVNAVIGFIKCGYSDACFNTLNGFARLGVIFLSSTLLVALALLIILFFIYCIGKCYTYSRNRNRSTVRKPGPLSGIKEAYISWKEKVCYPVDFK